eukprot:CAMPEP_0194043400 /NCGR_PEP_ID=MMETSP0009_2-20130614/15040_1 /TAXON_ID=210454 /ORGANISM="Grammatophora oceanica, Strain CCMP 410" /LENGTH=378 /DNA_ID=CAMNT_0038687593 /DNA_START=6 /DNA_END=1142 /DNA_ORIENTATION=-
MGVSSGSAAVHQPIGTRIVEKGLLFSPRTWWGLALFQATSPFRPLRLDVFLQSLVAIATTLVLSLFSPRRLLLAAVLSPWSLGLLATSVIPTMVSFASGFANLTQNRIPPLPSAISTLQERIESGRAYRYRRYDVYLPPKEELTTTLGGVDPQRQHEQTESPSSPSLLFFFPGMLVHHTAYSEVASKLSDHGILVVVLSMEPIRLGVFGGLGASPKRLRKILRQLGDTVVGMTSDSKFALGGHSLGAFTAMKLASQEDDELMKPSHLFLWGASPNFESVHTDISSTSVPCLLVQASKDNLCTPSSKDVLQRFHDRLPKSTTVFHNIFGGAHHQFGSYAEPEDVRYGGVPEIDTAKFHDKLCHVTSKFLLRSSKQDRRR